MMARIKGEVQTTWQSLLEAVELYSVEAHVGELAWLDVERLQAATNNIAIRLVEADCKGKDLK